MSMAHNPIDNQGGRTPLRRDVQQWVLDYIIQQTGKTYHFQGDGSRRAAEVGARATR